MAAAAFDGKSSFVAIPVARRKPRASLASTLVVYGLLVAGLTMVGAGVLAPLREEARRLDHQRLALQHEVDFVDRQMQVNRDFVNAVPSDPQLAMRLALRQRTNVKIAQDGGTIAVGAAPAQAFGQSPFALTSLPAPDPLPAYASDLPVLAQSWLIDVGRRGLVMGLGAFTVAAGLILGAMPTRAKAPAV